MSGLESRLSLSERGRDLITNKLRVVDLVFELVDARCPVTSRSPAVKKLIGSKREILILNKSDLADPVATGRWIDHFQEQGIWAVAADASRGMGLQKVRDYLEQVTRELTGKLVQKGRAGREVRCAVFGIPNIGKSTFLNRLIGRHAAATGNRPGITRGPQWVHLAGKISLLDTPGVLPPFLSGEERTFKLAVIGALAVESYDQEDVALRLIRFLAGEYPDRLKRFFGLTPEESFLEQLAWKKNFLLPDGLPDLHRAATFLLVQVRSGKLGRLTLERK